MRPPETGVSRQVRGEKQEEREQEKQQGNGLEQQAVPLFPTLPFEAGKHGRHESNGLGRPRGDRDLSRMPGEHLRHQPPIRTGVRAG